MACIKPMSVLKCALIFSFSRGRCRSLSIRPLFEMLDGHKTKLALTKLQDEEAPEEAAPEAAAEGADAAAGGADVSFPEDYPNSVRAYRQTRLKKRTVWGLWS